MSNTFILEEDEDLTTLDETHVFVQKKKGFRFSSDAVLLADFYAADKSNIKVLDIGTGNGILPVLLCISEKVHDIVGIDIQKENIILAKKNIEINGMTDRIKVIAGDIKEQKDKNTYDSIISNPPYMKVDGKKINLTDEKSVARHEICLDLEELISCSKKLLKPIGNLFLVHKVHRLQEIMSLMTRYDLSVKRLRFAYHDQNKDATLVLIEAWKGKKYILKTEPPLIYNNDQGK